MKSDKFGSQLERKSKTWFFSFLDVCFLNRTRQNSDLTAYFADQNRRKDDLMKMNFVNFQIQKWISQIVRAQKVDKKNGVICLISFFLSWVMVLKLHKIVHFLQICADLSKKPRYIKAIYFYPSEGPHHSLSENSIFK